MMYLRVCLCSSFAVLVLSGSVIGQEATASGPATDPATNDNAPKVVQVAALADTDSPEGDDKAAADAKAATDKKAAAGGKTPEKLTVMTWNLEWFYDDHSGDNYSKLAKEKSAPSRADWDWHRDAVAKSIHQARPTILALQEVENRRVLWYLSRALDREFKDEYEELCDASTDHFTEQDVALMYREPAEALQITHFRMTKAMKKTQQYYDLSKHILGVFEIPTGTDQTERVTVMNIHLRSRPEGESIRIRQARLINHWIADRIAAGENVILLGDTNSEARGDKTLAESDIGIACGLGTETKADDLEDLHLRLPAKQRGTHLLPEREFDRIMVSKSLLEDDPSRPDLVFDSIEVLRDLSVQGELDTEQEHWDNYWERPADERDLSDHLPVQATFIIQ